MNMQAMLRQIDENIDRRRQHIAVLRVEISELEDSRKTLMRMADDQIAAAEYERQQKSLGAGSSAKPMLIVRKTSEEGATDEAPLGIVAGGKRKGLPRLRTVHPGKKSRRQRKRQTLELRDRIFAVIKPDAPPMPPREISDSLDVPREDEVARKAVSNMLYRMRTMGDIQRDGRGSYFRSAPNGASEQH